MKYIIKRMATIGGKTYKEPTEQYKSIGGAIYAYELYKWAFRENFACSENFVTREKIVFKARNKSQTVTITFEVVAE